MWYHLHIVKASPGLPEKVVSLYKPGTGVAQSTSLWNSTLHLHPIRKSIGSFDPMSVVA